VVRDAAEDRRPAAALVSGESRDPIHAVRESGPGVPSVGVRRAGARAVRPVPGGGNEVTRQHGKIHVVDAVALVLAAGLAVLAYSYLFRRTPVRRPVDPLLGAEITVEFRPDKPWKQQFPAVGASVLLEEYLEADVTSAETSESVRTVRLRVRGRETQKPEALTLFRTGVRRGSELRMNDLTGEVRVEVIDVRPATDLR
jgi:hypothetical protein